MNQEELEEFADGLSREWESDDYHGDNWWEDQIVEQFILWLYRNGGEIKYKIGASSK